LRALINYDLILDKGRLSGSAELLSADKSRSYTCQLEGSIIVKNGKIGTFNLVALGKFQGEGEYTRGAPPGAFPLAITFTLADGSDMADTIPPQGSRGWVKGYNELSVVEKVSHFL
jgi:hypothetical protein